MKKVSLNLFVTAALMVFGGHAFAQSPDMTELADDKTEASSGCAYEDQRCLKNVPGGTREGNPSNAVNYATCLTQGNCSQSGNGHSATGTN